MYVGENKVRTERLCIIGGCGFLGSNLYKSISSDRFFRDHDIVLLDRLKPSYRLRDGDIFVNADEESGLESELHSVTMCVNLASGMFLEGSPTQAMIKSLEGSVKPIYRLFPHMIDLRQCVHVSSISVYQKSIKGEALREGDILSPPKPYGVGKLASEYYMRYVSKRNRVILQMLRFPDIYGNWPRSRQDHRAYPELMRRIVNGEVWKQYGTGEERLDMIHVSDAAVAINSALKKPVSGIWNVGSERGYTMNQLIDILGRVSSKSVDVRRDRSRVYTNHFLDSERFYSDFDFKESVALEDGVSDEFKYHLREKTLG